MESVNILAVSRRVCGYGKNFTVESVNTVAVSRGVCGYGSSLQWNL